MDTYVELGTSLAARAMKGDELSAQEILARCNAFRDGDGLDASACDLHVAD